MERTKQVTVKELEEINNFNANLGMLSLRAENSALHRELISTNKELFILSLYRKYNLAEADLISETGEIQIFELVDQDKCMIEGTELEEINKFNYNLEAAALRAENATLHRELINTKMQLFARSLYKKYNLSEADTIGEKGEINYAKTDAPKTIEIKAKPISEMKA